jgi:hypothetical protein
MNSKSIKDSLLVQERIELKGNLYHKTQIDFSYNNNSLKDKTITSNETESIYDTGTILTSKDEVINLKDATETKKHFTLFKYMLETLEESLTEDMIKKYHFILKSGTLSNEEIGIINVGEYKSLKNFVGNITISFPKNVAEDMKKVS